MNTFLKENNHANPRIFKLFTNKIISSGQRYVAHKYLMRSSGSANLSSSSSSHQIHGRLLPYRFVVLTQQKAKDFQDFSKAYMIKSIFLIKKSRLSKRWILWQSILAALSSLIALLTPKPTSAYKIKSNCTAAACMQLVLATTAIGYSTVLVTLLALRHKILIDYLAISVKENQEVQICWLFPYWSIKH